MGSENMSKWPGLLGSLVGPARLVVPIEPVLLNGSDSLNDCRIVFVDEVFKIGVRAGNPMVENPMRSEF